jgi:hypothetical protein
MPMTSLKCFPGSAYPEQDTWFARRIAPTKNDFKSSGDESPDLSPVHNQSSVVAATAPSAKGAVVFANPA